MSAWRKFFSYNKFVSIAGKATRNCLKDSERVVADKRGESLLRYQVWNAGKAGEQVRSLI